MVGRIFLAIGLVGLPFTAWLNWDVTRKYPDSWRIEWYDLMFLRFPDNALAALIIGVVILFGHDARTAFWRSGWPRPRRSWRSSTPVPA